MAQGKYRNVNIFVEPDLGNPGHYKFSMDDGFGKTNELTFDKSLDGMWRWENYRVRFILNNLQGANLKFSSRLDKVLWAEPTELEDPPCPSSQKMDKIFWVKHRDDIEDLALTVTNKDPDRERFMFGFNFLPADENEGPHTPDSKYILYDPIGNNQNGGWPRSFATPSLLAVGGAAVGALATQLMDQAATTSNVATGAAVGGVAGLIAGLLLDKRGAGT